MTESKRDLWVLALGAIGLLILHAVVRSMVLGGAPFLDPDEFMRADRVLHLLSGGAWFDSTYPRVLPGLVQHWTRPTDAVIAFGALLLSPFMELKDAIELWGHIFPPLFHVAALFGLVWAIRPFAPSSVTMFVTALCLTQVYVLSQFRAGRIDHNVLFLLAFVLMFGLVLRLLTGRGGTRMALLAGVIGAIALWTSVESMIFVVAAVAGLGTAWFFVGGAFARLSLALSGALFGGLVLAGILERGFFDLLGSIREIDRISLFYVLLYGANFAFWCFVVGEEQIGRRLGGRLWGRALLGTVGAVAALSIVVLFQPQLLDGKVNQPDVDYLRLRVAHIRELQTVFSLKNPSLEQFVAALPQLGLALAATPFLAWLTWRGPREQRIVALYLLLLLALYTRSGVIPIKAVVYYGLIGILGSALLLAEAERIAGRLLPCLDANRRRTYVLAAGVLVFVLAPLAARKVTAIETPVVAAESRCDFTVGVRALAAATPGEPRAVMTFPDIGPELLYRTEHSVLSIPNHRPQPGFRAMVKAMNATDDAEARRALDEIGADILLMCDMEPVERLFGLHKADASFGGRLYDDRGPTWLLPLQLDQEAKAAGFKAFRILRDAGPSAEGAK